MHRKKLLPIVVAILVAAVVFIPGCDELITEVTEVTIAGHPTADFGVDVDSGCVPLTVTFVDLSNGPRTKWTWDFGDGDSSSDTAPTHLYDSAGMYTVSLKIEHEPTNGEDTEIKTRFIIAGQSIADFTASADSGCPGLEVTFTPIDYGGISYWRWDFGDGAPFSNDSVAVHTYDTVGEYSVTLSVDGACGQTILTDTNMIKITECPSVMFVADTVSGCKPLTVTFYDSTDPGEQGITAWLWDFGNDSTSTQQNPTVTYPDAGLYTVKLTVTSTGGVATDSIVDYITVYDSTQAIFLALSPVTRCISQYQQFQVKFEDSSIGDITNWTWDF